MPKINSEEKNAQFYNLILELVNTQKDIIERLDRIEKKSSKENGTPLKVWSDI